MIFMKNFTYNDELYHYGVKGMRWRHRKKTDPTKPGRTGPITSDGGDDRNSEKDKEKILEFLSDFSDLIPGVHEMKQLYKLYENLTKQHPEYKISNLDRSFRNQGIGVANLSGPRQRNNRRSRTTKRRRKLK